MILSAAAAATIQPPPRPNIVLFMTDDLGWGDTGFNGCSVDSTPNLDRMAAEGTILDRFYAAAPVCSPTRGSCLTGRHPYRYGIFGANTNHLPESEVTLAEMVKPLGYATGHFGKWHLGTMTRIIRDSNRGGNPTFDAHKTLPTDHGFDAFFSTEAKTPTWDSQIKPVKQGLANKWWNAVEGDEETVPYGTRYWKGDGQIVHRGLEGSDSRVIVEQAIDFMTEASKNDKPFFVVVWTHAPHLPVDAPAADRALFFELDDYSQNYFGSIYDLDREAGRLEASLKDLGEWDDTLFWFASDNGPEGQAGAEHPNYGPGSAGPFRGRKRSLYEGGVRVPAFVHWPAGLNGSVRTDAPSVTSDILPTAADILNIPLPSRPLDGVSVLSTLRGEKQTRPAIGFQSAKQATWVDGDWKLYTNGDTAELYNLVDDPGEKSPVDDVARVLRMLSELRAWQESCKTSLGKISG